MLEMGQHARRNGQHYTMIINKFGTTWSGWDAMKSSYMFVLQIKFP